MDVGSRVRGSKSSLKLLALYIALVTPNLGIVYSQNVRPSLKVLCSYSADPVVGRHIRLQKTAGESQLYESRLQLNSCLPAYDCILDALPYTEPSHIHEPPSRDAMASMDGTNISLRLEKYLCDSFRIIPWTISQSGSWSSEHLPLVSSSRCSAAERFIAS